MRDYSRSAQHVSGSHSQTADEADINNFSCVSVCPAVLSLTHTVTVTV